MACYKKIFLFILLFLVVFSTFSFGAIDTSYTNVIDNNYTILSYYQNCINDLVMAYNNTYSTNKTLWDNLFTAVKNGQFFYLNYTYNLDTQFLGVYLYNWNTSHSYVENSAFVLHGEDGVPTTLVNMTLTNNYIVNLRNFALYEGGNQTHAVLVPIILYKKIPTEFIELMERSGFTYNGETSILLDIKSELSNLNDKIDDLNDNITDSTVESSGSDLPSYSYNDTTKNGIDNQFSKITTYMTRTSPSGSGINLPIPFVNKNVFIPSNLTSNIISSIGNVNADMSLPNGTIVNLNFSGFLSNMISVFWWYIIARYIVLDIMNKTYKIQTGDIENLENENIKGDML